MSTEKDKEKEKPTGETSTKPPVQDKGTDLFAEIRERLEIADEMREIFEEDKVTHEHGSAEPEGD
jgi:hypothetical protein